jgi:dihydropteroate synthase
LQALNTKITLNLKGRLLSLEKPVVMGIINTTPDSFFSGSRQPAPDDALRQADQMLKEGAVFLDIGGYSSRPGAEDIPEAEELKRVIPVITTLSQHFPQAFLSIDTFRASVARQAIEAGAHLVNDISAGEDDPDMLETIAGLQVPYIMMHKKGAPQTMQQNPHYENVKEEVLQYFIQKMEQVRSLNIKDIILDPGFGFGKTLKHNYTLLNTLQDFSIFGVPVLAGVSRKGMIQRVIDVPAEQALNGTTVVNTIALMKGAKILRVHDVKEAVECVKLVNALNGAI